MTLYISRDYQTDLLQRFEQRDKREHVFTAFIDAHNKLVQGNIALTQQNEAIENTARAMKEENDRLNREISLAREQGTPLNQQRTAELETQIQHFKEDISELYKTQGQNAQRLVDMNEELRKKDEREKKNVDEIQGLTERLRKLTEGNEGQTHLLREKDVTIQLLQDELATVQLEFLKTEERLKDLEKENGQLLQRWLKKMNDEVEKVNEANSIYESVLEQARTAEQLTTRTTSTSRQKSNPDIFAPQVLLPTSAPKRLTAHDMEIYSIQASATSKFFATGSSDKKIKVFDARTGNPTQTLTGALQSVMCVAFNSKDDLILGASNDNATRLWNLQTGRIRISGSHDRTIKVWDLQKGYCIRTMFSYSSCNDVCLVDEDGSTLASGHLDNNLRLWDVRTGNGIKELTGIHGGQITSLSVSPDGSKILTNSRDNTLKLIDLRMYEVASTFQSEGYKNGANWSRACFSPDGSYVSAGSADGTLFFWNVMTGQMEKSVKEHTGTICAVSWSPDGSQIFTADKDRVVCIWGSGSARA
ncbi:autophagy protein 16 [Endogone sp. FLAS-F59071]|nr:autophagy protein 16 [Endogone sp. FLAS-F59071]|eukprot:RUS17762.1 autophagy protein 16 [Endogone sp. FLAS-F59071]